MRRFLMPFLLVSSTFVACTKNELRDSDSPNLRTISGSDSTLVDGMLNFSTITEYESFLDDSTIRASVTGATGYIPLSSITNTLAAFRADTSLAAETSFYSHPRLADTIYEDCGLLLDILNQHKMVGMGDYYVKIDLEQEKALVILKTVPEAINTLKTATGSTPNVTSYSLEEELVPIIFNLLTCFERWAIRDPEGDRIHCSSTIRSNYDVRYGKYGVYFELYASIKNQQKRRANWWADYLNPYSSISYASWDYEVRCGYSSRFGLVPSSDGTGRYKISENGSKLRYTAYHGMKALKRYDFSATTEGCGGTIVWNIRG